MDPDNADRAKLIWVIVDWMCGDSLGPRAQIGTPEPLVSGIISIESKSIGVCVGKIARE